MKHLLLLLISLCLFFVACTPTITKPRYLATVVDIEELPKIENKFERFRQQVLGHFSNKEQVKNEPSMREPEQEFIIMPIFSNRPDEFWVYLEFFSPYLVDKPVDQRIEQYVRIQRDTFRMEVYYLKKPEDFINEWKKEKPFEHFSIEKQLIRDAACDLLIVPKEGQHYVFESVPHPEITCDTKVSHGATRFVGQHFDLSDAGYNTRFRYYDIDKKLLHETDPRGIDFKRLDYRDKDYKPYDTE